MPSPQSPLPESPTCIASHKRIWWAYLRSGKRPLIRVMFSDAGLWTLSIDDARKLCQGAGTSLASLYLPDPSRMEMFRAWIYGRTHHA